MSDDALKAMVAAQSADVAALRVDFDALRAEYEAFERLDRWLDGPGDRRVRIDGRLSKPRLTYIVKVSDHRQCPNFIRTLYGRGAAHNLGVAITRAMDEIEAADPGDVTP